MDHDEARFLRETVKRLQDELDETKRHKDALIVFVSSSWDMLEKIAESSDKEKPDLIEIKKLIEPKINGVCGAV